MFLPSLLLPSPFLVSKGSAFPVCKKQQEAELLPQGNLSDRVQVLHISPSLIGQCSSDCVLIALIYRVLKIFLFLFRNCLKYLTEYFFFEFRLFLFHPSLASCIIDLKTDRIRWLVWPPGSGLY